MSTNKPPKEFTPPKFAKNAVMTNTGWVDPRNKKLVVPNKNLLNRKRAWDAAQALEAAQVPVEPKEEKAILEAAAKGNISFSDDFTSEPEEENQEEEPKPKRKRRRRKKSTTSSTTTDGETNQETENKEETE